jgi:hypothetical protein
VCAHPVTRQVPEAACNDALVQTCVCLTAPLAALLGRTVLGSRTARACPSLRMCTRAYTHALPGGRSTGTFDDMLDATTVTSGTHTRRGGGLVFRAAASAVVIVNGALATQLFLPPRSPYVAICGSIALLASCLQLFLAPIVLIRLSRDPTLRRLWNLSVAVLATLCTAPALLALYELTAH